jgi:hypothetical protein
LRRNIQKLFFERERRNFYLRQKKISIKEKIYFHQGENLFLSRRKFIFIKEKIYRYQGENKDGLSSKN